MLVLSLSFSSLLHKANQVQKGKVTFPRLLIIGKIRAKNQFLQPQYIAPCLIRNNPLRMGSESQCKQENKLTAMSAVHCDSDI